ncbi:hypothetical protein AK830_g506 [Neonectria ditissima]|uniref:S-adenosylmethionine mitochondrial carrier protein n=1 Tax=Neonectria ditissima TaxID=78410 RepID=A0A0P7BY55_9HYPO|nr:hypothetical protein AK830_g506 [Neonectria ditissima]
MRVSNQTTMAYMSDHNLGRGHCRVHSRHFSLSIGYFENPVSKPGLPENICIESNKEGTRFTGPVSGNRERSAGYAPSGCVGGSATTKMREYELTDAAGLFFSTYESAKRFIGRTTPLPEPLVHSSASAVAEMASCLVLAPAEVIKQNAQMLQGNQGGKGKMDASTSLRAFRQLGGAGAPKRLFTGYTVLVARNLPFTALQFPIYEHVRARVWESRSAGRGDTTRNLLETGLVTGCSAGGAGALAAFITTPSDVVKTRMMLSAGSQELNINADGKQGSKGAWAVTREVYRERGVRGFFRGAALRSGWTMVGSGLYLGTYEMAKVWLKRRKSDRGDDIEM